MKNVILGLLVLIATSSSFAGQLVVMKSGQQVFAGIVDSVSLSNGYMMIHSGTAVCSLSAANLKSINIDSLSLAESLKFGRAKLMMETMTAGNINQIYCSSLIGINY